MQFDGQMQTESVEGLKAKSEFEKIQVCIYKFILGFSAGYLFQLPYAWFIYKS